MEFLSKDDLDALWAKIKKEHARDLVIDGTYLKLRGSQKVSGTDTPVVLSQIANTSIQTFLGLGTLAYESLSNGKIPLALIPDAILGQMIYGGTVNGSGVVTLSQNAKDKWGITSLTLTPTNYSDYEGAYFIASADGASGVPSTLGVLVGDWIVATASGWGKVDNTDAVTGVKGDAETDYRIGNVNITKANIGLGNVGDFLAVSTVASQGLTDTQKSNARANIGLGTASTHAHTDYVTGITWDSTNRKLKQSKGGGTASDIVTFGAAYSYDVYDKTAAAAAGSSGTGLVTERGLYFALPSINGAHTYNSGSGFYAPTGAGTAGQVLTSTAGTPSWVNQSTLVAGKATQLETSRNIWGQSFNGTTAISGNMSSVGNISFSASGKNIGGIAYFDTTNLRLGVGTDSPTEELDVNGNIHSSGNIFADGGVAARGIADLAVYGGGGGSVTSVQVGSEGYIITPIAGLITLPDYPTWNTLSGKPTLATVATSGNYNDLLNKPTIPTVNNGNLYLQASGATKVTFSANQSGNSTFNIAQGSTDGTISVGGTDVAVKGLGGAAYKAADYYSVASENSVSLSGETLTVKINGTSKSLTNTNTWIAWAGATSSAAGTAGYMPAPTSAQRGQFLRGDGTWVDLNNYSLPLAASGTRGGIQVGFSTDAANRNYGVQLSSEKAYVNVPWTDRYVNSAAFAYDSTNDNIKMTLTRAGSDTSTVVANIPKATSSASGLMSKADKSRLDSIDLEVSGTGADASYALTVDSDTMTIGRIGVTYINNLS